MIDVLSVETSHLLQDALAAQYRFRFEHFVERNGWTVPHFRGMEYDQFDTPAAVYLLWRDDSKRVRGMVRLLPTTMPYMVETLWPELGPNNGLPHTEEVWENTRFAVDSTLSSLQRNRITGELIVASLEFGLQRGVQKYLVVSPMWVITRILNRSGLKCDLLKTTDSLGPLPVASAFIRVNSQTLSLVRTHYGISEDVSNFSILDHQIAA